MTSTGMPSSASGSGREVAANSAAPRRATCAAPDRIFPGSRLSNLHATAMPPAPCARLLLVRLGDERHALEAGPRHRRHHLGDAPVIDLLVAAHEDALVGAALCGRGEHRDDLVVP